MCNFSAKPSEDVESDPQGGSYGGISPALLESGTCEIETGAPRETAEKKLNGRENGGSFFEAYHACRAVRGSG